MQNPFKHLAFTSLTDIGLRRKNNEDAAALFPEHGAFFVADGMGGADDGEVASQAAVEALTEMFKIFPPEKPLTLAAKQAWVEHAANEASAWILNRSNTRGKAGTGTTLAGVIFDPENPGRAVALHAGDSRVYVAGGWVSDPSRQAKEDVVSDPSRQACDESKKQAPRDGSETHPPSIRLITRDHSFANEVGVAEETMLNPEFRNVILRALGLAPKVALDATPFEFATGDTVLVCSDGLTRMVTDSDIAEIIRSENSPEAAASALVARALENGGKDNVTVLLAKVGELPAPVPAAELEDALPAVVSAIPTASGGTPAGSGFSVSTDPTPVPTETAKTDENLECGCEERATALDSATARGEARPPCCCKPPAAWVALAALAALALLAVSFLFFRKSDHADTADPVEKKPVGVVGVVGVVAPDPEAVAREEALRREVGRKWFVENELFHLLDHVEKESFANTWLPSTHCVDKIKLAFAKESRDTDAQRAELAGYFAKCLVMKMDLECPRLTAIRERDPALWKWIESARAGNEVLAGYIDLLREVWEFPQ